MRFEVLGKSPAFQDAGGACSGYLLSQDDRFSLIDCGNGVFSKLRRRLEFDRVEAILISHFHADHVLDLIPFGYALTLGLGERPSPRPTLWLPPGGLAAIRRLVSTWGSGRLIDDAFEAVEYDAGAELGLGGVEARLHAVPHFTLTHAVELISPRGGRLLYGSDCRAGPELEQAASGVDVLVAEATLPEPEDAPRSSRGHMSAAEAGEIAARAGVGRLVLTHISDLLDPGIAVERAAAAFDGPIEVAAEGSAWELPQPRAGD